VSSQTRNLDGKVALVTGSYRGLGYTFALGLAEAGATVVVNGRSREGVRVATERLREAGHSAYGYAFDVTDSEEIREHIANIEEEVGDIHALVNNAGVQYRAPLQEVDDGNWRQVLSTNLDGPFLVSREVARRMIPRRSGKLVNICSLASNAGRRGIGPYTAAKGGLKLLTQAMCADWAGYNIQVNGIAPGYFKTELTKALVEDRAFNDYVTTRTPAGRWGEPEELVDLLILLCSEGSSFINGQVICVDGGVLATM
jgi:gluconate 5-dehydrogenase